MLYATGYTRNAIIHQGRLDAEVELLTKPFTAEALARKVRQILNAQPQRWFRPIRRSMNADRLRRFPS